MVVLRPLVAIRKNCLECSGFSHGDAKYCCVVECTFWHYRFGLRPTTIMADNKKKHLLRADLMEKTTNMTWQDAENFLLQNSTKEAEQ